MSSDFLPPQYELPKKSGKYMKLQEGENRFRILASPLTGWIAWKTTKDGKRPVRKPEDAWQPGEFDKGKGSEPKHFWAFPVWNYEQGRVQVLELTQYSVIIPIKQLSANKKWGHPSQYDLVVTATGNGMEREYPSVMPEPKEPLFAEAQAMWDEMRPRFDINRLLSGGDPFGDEGDAEVVVSNEEEEPIPF